MRAAAFIGILIGIGFLICLGKPYADEMVQLAGNHPTSIAGKPTGPIDPHRTLRMAITLKIRDPQALHQFLAGQQNPNSPNYHKWLTPKEFAERFGPDPAKFRAVRDWLVAQEFDILSADLERRSITFSGSAIQAEKVFRTRIMSYPGGHYANITDPWIPARFAGVIGAISGLDNMAHAIPLTSHRTNRRR